MACTLLTFVPLPASPCVQCPKVLEQGVVGAVVGPFFLLILCTSVTVSSHEASVQTFSCIPDFCLCVPSEMKMTDLGIFVCFYSRIVVS